MIKKSEISRGKDFTDIYFCSLPNASLDLGTQVKSMFDELGDDAKHIQYERIFSQDEYMGTVRQIRGDFYKEGRIEPPATSYIAIPPCNGAKVGMVAIGVRPTSDNELKIETVGGDFYNRGRIVEYDGFRQMYAGNVAGVWNRRLDENLIPQIQKAFLNLDGLLKESDFDFRRDMMRMWFSILNINKERPHSKRTNYMDFNEDVRAVFLDHHLKFIDSHLKLRHRYFASTGVGNGVCKDGRFAEIGAIAYKQNRSVEVIPMKNPKQMDVYRYTECDNPDKEKSNVRFERGLQVITPTIVLYIVAGTAPIRDNKEIEGSLEVQTNITIENIEYLLKPYYGKLSDSMMAVTYVKPGEDAKVVERILNERGIGPAHMPHLIVFNEMCYRPLKVETELFAAVPLKEYNKRIGKTA